MTTSPVETVLITGAGAGICLRLAEQLAYMGQRLILVDSDGDALARVHERLRASVVAVWNVDACDSEAIRARYSALDADDRPTVLVNGVGGDARSIPLGRLDEETVMESLRHNLLSAFVLTQQCIPDMKKRGRGRLVFLASIAGRSYSVFSNAAYVASKAAVVGFMKQCAYELAAHGVTANAVAHGPIMSERIEAAWACKSQEEQRDILSKIPLGRRGSLDEAAHFLVPLCVGPAGFATGAVIDVNGGLFV